MRRALWAVILVCGVHVVASLAWAARQPEAPIAYFTPSRVVMKDAPIALTSEAPEHDFGALPQQAVRQHVFRVTNSGASPVHIDRVHSSCGCTVADLARHDLAPGESVEVAVTFTAGAMTGPFHKTLRLYVKEGTLALTVRGRVLTDFAPDPAALSFGSLKVGETARRTVTLYPTRPGATWSYGPPYTMDPELVASEPVAHDGAYRLELALTPRRFGPRAGVVTLPGKVPLFVRYSARVEK